MGLIFKAIPFIIQAVTLPLIMNRLGQRALTDYIVLYQFLTVQVLFTTMLTVGLSKAAAHYKNDTNRLSELIKTHAIIIPLIGLSILILLIIQITNIQIYLSTKFNYLTTKDLHTLTILLISYLYIIISTSFVEPIRTGVEKDYLNSKYAIISTAVHFVTISLFLLNSTFLFLILGQILAPVLSRILNLISFYSFIKSNVSRATKFQYHYIYNTVRDGFWLSILTLASFIFFQQTIFYISGTFEDKETIVALPLFHIFLLSGAIVVVFAKPLIPLFAELSKPNIGIQTTLRPKTVLIALLIFAYFFLGLILTRPILSVIVTPEIQLNILVILFWLCFMILHFVEYFATLFLFVKKNVKYESIFIIAVSGIYLNALYILDIRSTLHVFYLLAICKLITSIFVLTRILHLRTKVDQRS